MSTTTVSSSRRLLSQLPMLQGRRCCQNLRRRRQQQQLSKTTLIAVTTQSRPRYTAATSFIDCRSFSSNASSSSNTKKAKTKTFRWLDLEGSGLSMLERLSLEEALLRNTQDNWIIVGRHSVWPPKYFTVKNSDSINIESDDQKSYKKKILKTLPEYITTRNDEFGGLPNPNGMIVMGIGGKADKLLNSQKVKENKLLVVKRFSGGGTVVMDDNAIWTTLIAGRKNGINQEEGGEEEILCKPYPRDIMKWTANAVFGPTFDKMNAKTIQESETTTTTTTTTTTEKIMPTFSLREDDYVLNKTRKMGGNAQAITGRQGWLHHTSFLWDYDDINMERYLKLPDKRPDYRVDRSHEEFLVKLKEYYGEDGNGKGDAGPSIFIESMKEACEESLEGGIREADWPTVYREVFGDDVDNNNSNNMEAWWLENRTRIQHEL